MVAGAVTDGVFRSDRDGTRRDQLRSRTCLVTPYDEVSEPDPDRRDVDGALEDVLALVPSVLFRQCRMVRP
jgi:hypothetical protein